MPNCSTLRFTVLHCTIPHYTVIYYIILYLLSSFLEDGNIMPFSILVPIFRSPDNVLVLQSHVSITHQELDSFALRKKSKEICDSHLTLLYTWINAHAV